MRSLFSKIFVSFWVTITLIAVVLFFSVIFVSHKSPLFERQTNMERRVRLIGDRAVTLYETIGNMGLSFYADFLNERFRMKLYLVSAAGEPLFGEDFPPGIRRIVDRARFPGKVLAERFRKRPFLAVRVKGITGRDYVTILEVPGGIMSAFLDVGAGHVVVIIVILLSSAVVCFYLARSLSSPLYRLKSVVDEFSKGNLTARADPMRGKSYTEVEDLFEKFNSMAERIEKLVYAHRDLMRDISHELKSPLTRMQVAIELARRGQGEEVGVYLDRVECEVERVSDLISRLILLSRMENAGDGFERERIDFPLLVEEVCADARFEGKKDEKDVVCDVTARPFVLGVPDLLRSALENVIRNGVRHTPPGSTVRVTVGTLEKGDECFSLVTVRDEGEGVPEDEMEKIFAPFHRVRKSGRREGGGAGLGLAIAKKAVELHGGRIEASNAPGRGFEVRILLPVS